MIQVKIEKEKEYYKQISILGHAMYADFGKDIVCSSVSSIVTTTVNGILSFDANSLTYQVDQKGMMIHILKNDHITQTLIRNMIHLLKELQESYKEFIEIK